MSGGTSLRRAALVALVLLAASALLVSVTVGSSSRMAQGIHGLHHSAYAYQIANGIVPPTNPSSMGAPANFYWAWHALLALAMAAFEITPFEALLLANTLALALLVGALWLAASRWTGSSWRRLGISLLPFFILNPVGMTQFAGRAAQALGPVAVESLREGEVVSLATIQTTMRERDGLNMHAANSIYLMPRGWDTELRRSKRIGNLLVKFFGFSSFPLAAALFAAALATLSVWRSALWTRCAAIAVASAAMALFSPVVAVAFGALVAAHCAVFAYDYVERRRANLREGHAAPGWRGLAREWLPAAAAGAGVLTTLPYLLEVSAAFGGSSELLLDGTTLLRHAVVYGWALLPSLPIYAVAGLLLPRLCPAQRTFWLGGLLLMAGALVVEAPTVDPNQYKLGLLSSIPTALLLLGLLAELDISGFPGARGARWLGRCVNFGLAAAGLLAIVTTSLLFVPTPWRDQSPYVYAGAAMELDLVRARRPATRAERDDLQEAYRWLRSNTPPTAYVAELPAPKDDLELSSLGQRRVVAALPSVFTKEIPYQRSLVRRTREVISRLGECRLRPHELRRLFGLPAPWPDEIYALVRIDEKQLRSAPRCERSWSGPVKAEWLSAHYAVFRIDVTNVFGGAPVPAGKAR